MYQLTILKKGMLNNKKQNMEKILYLLILININILSQESVDTLQSDSAIIILPTIRLIEVETDLYSAPVMRPNGTMTGGGGPTTRTLFTVDGISDTMKLGFMSSNLRHYLKPVQKARWELNKKSLYFFVGVGLIASGMSYLSAKVSTLNKTTKQDDGTYKDVGAGVFLPGVGICISSIIPFALMKGRTQKAIYKYNSHIRNQKLRLEGREEENLKPVNYF